MNNEKMNQMIDNAWMNFSNAHHGILFVSKDDFIERIKDDPKFSKKWGLKIEERELSLGERGELFRKEHPNKSVNDFAPNGMEVQSLNHQLNTRYNNANIPTKLITITYNGTKIESYEN